MKREDEEKFDGQAINLFALNMFLYGKADPDAPDFSPEGFEAAKPKIKDGVMGKLVMVGTKGDFYGDDFKKLWLRQSDNQYNAHSYR